MKKLLTTIALVAGLLLSSCLRQEYVPDEGKVPPNTLRLSVDVKGIGTEVASRASIAPEQGEDQVDNLILLFFQSDPYQGGTFVDYVKIDGPMPMDTDIDLSTHSQLSISGAYNILAVANASQDYLAESVDAWSAGWQGKTEYQALAEATAYTEAGGDILPTSILMNGRVTKSAEQYKLNLTLTRNMARFDVHNNQKESYDLVSVSVWNAYPTSSIWGEGSPDYSGNAPRIRRFYGVDNSDNVVDGLLGNISGGLYVFENRVAAPKANDQQTTCLIIGLKERTGDQTTTYYRANIHPAESAQSLKRNNVYRLTIRNVNGVGSASEELAYAGQGNSLDYVVNYWDMDDNGLIIQDGNSIIALPSKTIRLGRDGGKVSHSIYTYSNLPSAPTLAIGSQTWEPADGSISASLTGNTLNVQATPLGLGETERRGVVVLTYAGLEATVTVIQSGATDTYLKVILPDGGIPAFAPFPGMSSGLVRVEASGDWTAKLYMEGFSFDSNATPLMTINNNSSVVIDNKFRVWTHSANSTSEVREAFVVVSLDSDPENYASVIRLSQKAKGGISLSPEQSRVTFNGQGTGLAGNVTNNTVQTFNVYPTDGENVVDWTFRMMQAGANDDRAFFTATPVKDMDNVNGNTITPKAVAANTSERAYSAIMRVYLASDENTYVDVQLVQQSQSIDIRPGSFLPIDVAGGQTGLIDVVADAGEWSASIATTGTAGTRSLVNHNAYLVDAGGTAIAQDTPQALARQFRVVFPKVYYPNRDIPVSATITLNLVGTSKYKTFTVTQNTLTSKGVYAYDMTTGWGSIRNKTGEWFNYYATNVRTITGFSLVSSPTAIPNNTSYVHVVNQDMSSGYGWSTLNTFMANVDGITVAVFDDDDSNSLAAVRNNFSADYTFTGRTGRDGKANAAVADTKIMKFLTTNGAVPIQIASISEFHQGGANLAATKIPSTAVPVIVQNNNAGNVYMAIDPVKKFIFIGEPEMFNTSTSGNRDTFCDNLFYYVGNAARYGSHFTDMLRDDLDVPAPWDDAWGDNKGVTK